MKNKFIKLVALAMIIGVVSCKKDSADVSGNRYITKVVVNKINNLDDKGKEWDLADGTAPDIVVKFSGSGMDLESIRKYNIDASLLPITIAPTSSNLWKTPNGEINISLMEYDDGNILTEMASFKATNFKTLTADKDKEQKLSFTQTDAGKDDYNIDVYWIIKD